MDSKIIELASNRIIEQFCPAKIASELKMRTDETIEHLFVAIGKGLIRESDLFFALDEKYNGYRNAFSSYFDISPSQLRGKLRAILHCVKENTLDGVLPVDSDVDEIELYISFLKRRVFIGEIYLLLTGLERMLHHKIESVLKQKFGDKESGWWKLGVPGTVRVDCARAREFDDESVDHPYNFTNFIHLQKIMHQNWELFYRKLPQSVVEKKKEFLTEIARLNTIRNQVMHPVHKEPPTEDDFKFVRTMHGKLDAKFWR